jgi:outer membrane protein
VIKNLTIYLFAPIWFIHPLIAQQSYTLQNCIEIALKNNISLQQQKLQTEGIKADATQSRLNALPSVNGNATNNWQTGFAINPRTNLPEEGVTFRTNSIGLSASMPIFNGFQNSNNIRLQQANLEASKQDIETTQNNIMLNVCNAYLRVLLNIELEKAAADRVNATRKQAERQEAMFNLGSTNKARLLQIKAQLATEELAFVNAQNQTKNSYTELWLLINVKPDTANSIVIPGEVNAAIQDEPRSVDDIFADFTKISPEIKATEKRIRASELQRSTALGGRSPRLNLNASLNSFFTTQSTEPVGVPTITGQREIGYWLNNNVPVPVYVPIFSQGDIRVKPYSEQFKQNFGTVIGFNLQLPIFNGWNVNTNIKKATLNMQNAKLNNVQTRNNLYRTITLAYNDFKAAYKRFESTKLNYEANREAFEVAEKQFDLGAINIVEYLNIKNNFIRTETDLAQAKYELLFRRKVLDFYTGNKLY